jgi:hypothetical protein
LTIIVTHYLLIGTEFRDAHYKLESSQYFSEDFRKRKPLFHQYKRRVYKRNITRLDLEQIKYHKDLIQNLIKNQVKSEINISTDPLSMEKISTLIQLNKKSTLEIDKKYSTLTEKIRLENIIKEKENLCLNQTFIFPNTKSKNHTTFIKKQITNTKNPFEIKEILHMMKKEIDFVLSDYYVEFKGSITKMDHVFNRDNDELGKEIINHCECRAKEGKLLKKSFSNSYLSIENPILPIKELLKIKEDSTEKFNSLKRPVTEGFKNINTEDSTLNKMINFSSESDTITSFPKGFIIPSIINKKSKLNDIQHCERIINDKFIIVVEDNSICSNNFHEGPSIVDFNKKESEYIDIPDENQTFSLDKNLNESTLRKPNRFSNTLPIKGNISLPQHHLIELGIILFN